MSLCRKLRLNNFCCKQFEFKLLRCDLWNTFSNPQINDELGYDEYTIEYNKTNHDNLQSRIIDNKILLAF